MCLVCGGTLAVAGSMGGGTFGFMTGMLWKESVTREVQRIGRHHTSSGPDLLSPQTLFVLVYSTY